MGENKMEYMLSHWYLFVIVFVLVFGIGALKS